VAVVYRRADPTATIALLRFSGGWADLEPGPDRLTGRCQSAVGMFRFGAGRGPWVYGFERLVGVALS
jgi:hypothetical protein